MSDLGILTTERSVKKLVMTFTFCNLGILEDVRGRQARFPSLGGQNDDSASSDLEFSLGSFDSFSIWSEPKLG